MVIKSQLPDITIPRTGILQFLFENSSVPENKKVFFDAFTGESLTLGQLKDNIFKFAAGLQDKFGFNKGDVVAIYSPNQMDYAVPLLGAVAAGGAATPANPAYTPNELAYQLEMTKAKILIAHSTNVEFALKAAELVGLSISNIFIFGDEVVNGILPYKLGLLSDRHAGPVEISPEESESTVAYLCFSSGTTGKSKGVMTTHHNIVANVLQYQALDRDFLDPNKDVMLGVLPFFHIFALTLILHSCLHLGIPTHVMPRFDLVKFCETVQNKKVTYTMLVPPIILLLAKHPIISEYDLSTLRLVICGAAPLGADLSKQVKARLPELILKQGYGLTETSPCALIEPSDKVIWGSTGLLLSNMSAKIVDDEGKEVQQGERGELWLHGPNIMKGYINNPEATNDCIDKDGYFHTGDVAVQDKEGHFYIVDRIKELIKYKGFQVPPAELESLLLKSKIIADCAVIGVYDPEQATELPRAYIVLQPDVPKNELTVNEIKKFVADQVVHYKQLRSVVFIDEIPKSASGKILRRILRDAANKEQEEKSQRSKL
ncbi:acetyl-CoA synthetase-like protein [Backusella circina FSU 941]|nr:acetyl-CoA synthetase-like protein [Backusella circina FSU 941]